MPNSPAATTEIERGQRGHKVACVNCGHADEVMSAIAFPTEEITRKVCQRDPCPACGRRTMEPVRA